MGADGFSQMDTDNVSQVDADGFFIDGGDRNKRSQALQVFGEICVGFFNVSVAGGEALVMVTDFVV
jgi:hypothetical protein